MMKLKKNTQVHKLFQIKKIEIKKIKTKYNG
jgi:hypothetical protein